MFIKDLVIREGLIECNTNVISMKVSSSIKITDPKNYKETNLRIYQQHIRKIINLACRMRPHIAFAVGQLINHNINPRRGHLQVTKQVVQYLKGTIEMGLIFG